MSVSLLQLQGVSLTLSNPGSSLRDGELLRHSQELVVQSENFRCSEDNEETKMCLAAMKTVASRHGTVETNSKG